MAYKPSRYEMETTITFNRYEPNARIYTADPVMLRKLDKLCSQNPVFSVLREDELSKTYSCPKKLVNIRKPTVFKGSESKNEYSTKKEESA